MSILTKPPSQKEGKADKAKKSKQAKSADTSSGRRRATVTQASVNLLSPWVLDEIRVRRLRARFLVGALVLVLLLAATWAFLRMNLANSESDLEGEQAVADGLSAQITELGDVRTYVGDVTIRTTSVEDTMANELAYATVFRALREALPADALFVDVVVSRAPDADPADPGAEAPADAPVCPGPDPYGARVTVGCVVLSGLAGDRDDVSSLVEALDDSGLFVEPFITTTVTDEVAGVAVKFEGSVGLSPKTLTERYQDVDGSEDDQADQADDEEKTP